MKNKESLLELLRNNVEDYEFELSKERAHAQDEETLFIVKNLTEMIAKTKSLIAEIED